MKDRNKIFLSAIVLTKNEEKHIVDCLESISFCDEIIVIDDNSEDRTVEIARKMGGKVFSHSLENNFSNQRNFGLSKAKGEWVLFVDADELITSELQKEITFIVQIVNTSVNGFYIQRKDKMWGKLLEHGEVGNIKIIRLGRRNAGRWMGKVHEIWQIDGKLNDLNHFILHYPHQSISEFLREINLYTSIRAEDMFKNFYKKVSWYDISIYPTAKFVLNYIIKLGFLDGIPGLILAILMSFHSFLVRGKLWLLQNKK